MRDTAWLIRKWEEARLEADQSGKFVLVFDEIQKIPGWSATVKGLWDSDRMQGRPLHVVIMGSAPMLMQSGLTESLAGRFERIRVTHWSFEEMADAFGFDLPQYLYFGGYPGAVRHVRNEDRWRDYVRSALIEPNIEKDVIAMTRVDKPALMGQLLELGALYSGQIFSYNKMLGQLQDAGNTTTLARYLHLLRKVGLLAGLQKYSNRPHLTKASSPKLNVLNTSLMTAISKYSFAEAQADRSYWGRLVESAVGAHLLNTAGPAVRVRYWRESPHEVDFVLQGGLRSIAIEVASGSKAFPLSGMEAYKKRFHPIRSLLVGGSGIPLEAFLKAPADYWFEEAESRLDRDRQTRVDGQVNEAQSLEVLHGRFEGSETLSPEPDLGLYHETIQAENSERRREYLEQQHEENRRLLDYTRSNEAALRENRAPPALLHYFAEAYFGDFSRFNPYSGTKAIANRLKGDSGPIDAVLKGLRDVILREDVPSMDEILSLYDQRRIHYLERPFLAGLAEMERTAPEDALPWDEDRMRTAITIYYGVSHGDYRPKWYERLLEAHPEIVVEVQVRFAVSELRRGSEHTHKLWELAHDPRHAQIARMASLTLLRSFPIRCKLNQIQSLDHLLWASIQHADRELFQKLIEKKLSRTSMNPAQRAHWLAAGFTVDSKRYQDDLNKFVCSGRDQQRIRQLAAFFSPLSRLEDRMEYLGKLEKERLIRIFRAKRILGDSQPYRRFPR